MRYQRVSTSTVTPELFALAANGYIAVSSLFILKFLDRPLEHTIFLMLQRRNASIPTGARGKGDAMVSVLSGIRLFGHQRAGVLAYGIGRKIH